jgi:type I site-specific restriction endonuclease
VSISLTQNACERHLPMSLSEYTKENSRFVVKITGDDTFGKMEIENFINPESKYPVIATTSKLLSTGVDTKTVQLIVLDAPMNSMTEFKQIIGRGTRVEEQYGKYYFTIMDFRNVTRLFADPAFDGDPVKVYEHDGNDSVDVTETIESRNIIRRSDIKEHDPLGRCIDRRNRNRRKAKENPYQRRRRFLPNSSRSKIH